MFDLPVVRYFIRFSLISAFLSWVLFFLYLALFAHFEFEIRWLMIPLFPACGILSHYILNKDIFLKNVSFPTNLSRTRLYIAYVIMYVVILFTCAVTYSTAGHFILAPVLGFVSNVMLVRFNFFSINKTYKRPEKTQEPRESPSPKNVEQSVIPVYGDDQTWPEYTIHGSAHWISNSKKNGLTTLKDGKPTREGLWIGGGFFHHKEGNLVSVAPPGTGKGAALIIPNLLWERNYKHSFVVFDPKGTNACVTARFQLEQGKKVIIIDPMNLQKANHETHNIASANFNPLDHIKHDVFNGASQIANLLIPDDPNGERFWNQDARNLVQAILMHIMTDETYIQKRHLVTLYKEMLSGDIEALLDDMILNEELDGAISDFAKGFYQTLTKSEQTFNSIRTVANGSIKWLSNPALQACMKSSDFDPNDLAEGGTILYLCQPIQNKEGFATFSRLIVGFCLRANSKPASKPKAWVYYLLDEFPTMGVFPEVIEALAYSREYKMRLWIFGQSLSQLDQIYKPEGRHEILGSAGILQAFGVTDHVTQEYISKRIGNKTVKVYTTSTSESKSQGRSAGQYSSGTSSSTSDNESFHARPLIEPNEVQYDPNIITISEWGPMRLSRWQYWQDDTKADYYRKIFLGRADKNPNYD